MALSATIDTTASPFTLTVTAGPSDRKFSVTVASAGQTATATGQWPVTVTDSSGHKWTLKSDDGVTAVFTY